MNSKKFLAAGLASLLVVFLCGCGSSEDSGSSGLPTVTEDDDKMTLDECYSQCEAWGGSSADLAACKKNCDGSADANSVWNADDDEYNSDAVTGVWPAAMPVEVPEFSYGTAGEAVDGMGSWIVDFENVPADALEKYKADLEDAGWTASVMTITNTLNGKLTGKYTIQVMHDPDYATAQIMVRKSAN